MAEVKMIVEGVYSAKAAKELAEKYDVEMPIITEINKVLFEGKSAAEAVIDLMEEIRKWRRRCFHGKTDRKLTEML